MPAATHDPSDGAVEEAFARRGCCFFWGRRPPPSAAADGEDELPCSVAGGWWERVGPSSPEERPWWVRGWRRVREWSEVAAGPRWKTFIRRVSRGGRGGGGRGKYQYDPLSYKMNFDEGKGQECNFDEDCGWRDFSSRYASIPASCKSSMDLGKSGGPTFD